MAIQEEAIQEKKAGIISRQQEIKTKVEELRKQKQEIEQEEAGLIREATVNNGKLALLRELLGEPEVISRPLAPLPSLRKQIEKIVKKEGSSV